MTCENMNNKESINAMLGVEKAQTQTRCCHGHTGLLAIAFYKWEALVCPSVQPYITDDKEENTDQIMYYYDICCEPEIKTMLGITTYFSTSL